MGLDDWAGAQPLDGERLALEPLRVEHADEMAPLLDDPSLHTFIGGEPATLQELRDRYARQVVGQTPDGSQRWLNWIVRLRDNRQAVGFVQATISEQDGELTADLAWVVAPSQQGSGYARESVLLMASWLRQQHIHHVVAHIHPDHHASNAVGKDDGNLDPYSLTHRFALRGRRHREYSCPVVQMRLPYRAPSP